MRIEIHNNEMLERALERRNGFKKQALRCDDEPPAGIHRDLWKANCDAAKSLVEEFDAEIERYLKFGPPTSLK